MTHHVLREVGLHRELDPTKRTAELPLALVVRGFLVILQGRPVAEHGRA